MSLIPPPVSSSSHLTLTPPNPFPPSHKVDTALFLEFGNQIGLSKILIIPFFPFLSSHPTPSSGEESAECAECAECGGATRAVVDERVVWLNERGGGGGKGGKGCGKKGGKGLWRAEGIELGTR